MAKEAEHDDQYAQAVDHQITPEGICNTDLDFSHLESLFGRALGGTYPILDIKLWHLYISHVRREKQAKAFEENSLDEEVLIARQAIMKAFELALQAVGYYDVDSICIWNDFLEFVKGVPVSLLLIFLLFFFYYFMSLGTDNLRTTATNGTNQKDL